MKNKKFYKRAIEIAWPSVLESFFIALAGIIDTYMVSSIGSSAVAAVGLTTQPKFIALSMFFAINIATSALVARRLGEKDKEGANRILVTTLLMSVLLTVVVSSFMVCYSDSILKLAGSNSDTHTDAFNYFRIIMGGMIFTVISMAINAAQRGSGNTRIAFTTNLVSSVVNIFFNYCLIGGNFGFPRLGVSGAAMATVTGTVVSSLMCVKSLYKKDGFVQIKYIFEEKIKPTLDVFVSIVKLGTNLFVENIAMRIGFLTTALMAASLGTDTFAAHNVGMNILSICFAFADGMQVAAVVLTGSSLGAGKKEDAKIFGKVCQRIGFCISMVLCVILLCFGKQIFDLFFEKQSIVQTGEIIARFIAVIALLQISQIIYGGCLRSAGDVKYTLISSIVSVTIIRTTVTYILVSVFKMGIVGIWLGVLSDQSSRFLFNSTRFRQGKWVNIKI
ncbi:MATE family efflux transporter [uncultured Finegoldia sp.]|uniref:MATE family efflux transporter n=1 Tax=uncultured Finegoldia sp. TaxID=328009 RepID=UPI00260F7D61|nr:MATE family efflux transporter [uncultured Finegoldia sp.]